MTCGVSMKRISVQELQPNTIINQTLYDKQYNILVQKGTLMNEKMLDTIKHYGYLSVYVKSTEDDRDDKVVLPFDEMDELSKLIKKSEQEYKNYLKKREYGNSIALYKRYAERRNVLVLQLQRLSEDIIIFLIRNKVKSFQYYESKSLVLYGAQHAIQTAILSVLMGMEMALAMSELKILFISSILMEFSNLAVPTAILEKKGSLTPDEFECVKTHTAFYVKEFHDCDKIHHLVRIVTQQHHERYNGSGYPLGLKGDLIHPLARIVMVADTYDALVSDRNQRGAWSSLEALTYLTSQSGKLFHEEAVATLNRIAYPYKVGDRVKLNIGYGVIEGFDDTYNLLVLVEGLNKKVHINHGSGIKIVE